MSDPGQALHDGEVVILPTDTVYGLCASASAPEPVERLYALKGRGAEQPSCSVGALYVTKAAAEPSRDYR